MNKVMLFIGGFLCVVIGLVLVIRQWEALVIIVEALGGVLMAVAGLVLMFAAGMKK